MMLQQLLPVAQPTAMAEVVAFVCGGATSGCGGLRQVAVVAHYMG